MATDQRLGPETNPSPHADPEIGGPVRELAEALTALGSYLVAAKGILADGPTAPVERLGDVLDKSMGQYERAAKAARQLHRLYVHGSEDDDTLPGVRR